MRRLGLAALTLAVVLLLAAPAAVAQDDGSLSDAILGGLRDEMAHRLETDLAGDLDRRGRKRARAATRIVKWLGRDTDDLGKIARTATRIDRLLRKAFSVEFQDTGLRESDGTSLPTLLDETWDSISARVGDRLDLLDLLQPAFTDRGAARVSALAEKAIVHAEAAGDAETGRSFTRSLRRAAKFVARGEAAAVRDLGAPLRNYFGAVIGSTRWEAEDVALGFTEGAVFIGGSSETGEEDETRVSLFIAPIDTDDEADLFDRWPISTEGSTLRLAGIDKEVTAGSATIVAWSFQPALVMIRFEITVTDENGDIRIDRGVFLMIDPETIQILV